MARPRRTVDTVGKIGERFRLQSIIFKIASTIYNSEKNLIGKEAKELFGKTKRAIELQQIEKHQSEVNRNNMETVAAFLNSVKEIPNVAVVFDFIL